MGKIEISGDQAVAYGALQAGVFVATSYPGSPSSNTIEFLKRFVESHGLHIEWSTNEKVAFETAVGASIGGVPALMGCKGVGFNIALDPIMVANLTDVGAGLVILLGDDPGAWASQNDQDTRPIAWGTELPMLEPATPSESIGIMREAYRLSYENQVPVIVRITKTFGTMKEVIELPEISRRVEIEKHSFERFPMRWISVPGNAVQLHKRLHDRLKIIGSQYEKFGCNVVNGQGPIGIIAAGVVHAKLMDVLHDVDISGFTILKLSTLWPLPANKITSFLATTQKALVLEENEPFIETLIKSISYDAKISTPISGKQDGCVSREGELFRWQIAEALASFCPTFKPSKKFLPAEETKYLPSESGLPENCPYTPVFNILRDLSQQLNLSPVYVVDPGCAIKINTEPFEMLDIKYSMGSSIGIGSGLVLAGVTDPVVAVVGDSDFYHQSANALFNVVHHGSDLLVLILDNSTTALSGFQGTPNLGGVDLGHSITPVSIDAIVESCSVNLNKTINPWNEIESREVLEEGLNGSGVRVIIARSPCPYIEEGFCPGYKPDCG
tara:strand:+ start:83006 stop:84673 length:1668 start_codon:yes stop_codon:yes gene_type:complete